VREISIFFFHNVLNYGLMLAVMMFNGYIFVAVVMGAFIGYFLFGHLSMKTNMENLQAIQTKIICSTRCADSGK
jgi:solute carrier family 31 (copper transporter), member 1